MSMSRTLDVSFKIGPDGRGVSGRLTLTGDPAAVDAVAELLAQDFARANQEHGAVVLHLPPVREELPDGT